MFGKITSGYIGEIASYKNVISATDKSGFRPDSEAVRSFKYNPSSGSGATPLYDYPDGKIPKPEDDNVTDEIVALRSGRLDKADAQLLQQRILDEAKKSNDETYFNKVKQSLDKALGISESSEGSEK